MRHVTVENLIDYIESQASDVEKSTLERHMTDCNECEELKQEFQIVIARLRRGATQGRFRSPEVYRISGVRHL